MALKELILCSKSPRRQQILSEHKISYTTIPNQLQDEPKQERNESPLAYVTRLATLKLTASRSTEMGFILAADTILLLKGEVIGKPESDALAFRILKKLLGKTHLVITACAISNPMTGAIEYCIDYATVKFKQVSDQKLLNYIDQNKPLDKAGAYGIQDDPPFLESYNGDYFTVMGLPIKRLLKLFNTYGIV